jgi:hypothetical protein
MTNCPKCGKEIDILLFQGKQVQVFKVYSGEDGLEYLWIATLYGLEDEKYACPECGETLFTNDVDATNFLMGEKVIEE